MKTMKIATTLLFLLIACFLCYVRCAKSGSSSSFPRRNIPGRPYDDDDFLEQQNKKKDGFQGSSREFNLFDTRDSSESSSSTTKRMSSMSSQRRQNRRQIIFPDFFQEVRDWWSTRFPESPKLQIRYGPTYTLKVRKTFRPLGTILKVGADFQHELGVWRLHGSWEDPFVHGNLSYQGTELRFTKSWALPASMAKGSFNNDDMVTRLRLRCSVDTHNWKAYARLGFRTEQLTPLNFMEGFPTCHRIPLNGGNIALELKSTVTLPQPEIEISTEINNKRHALWAGMADLEVNVEEINGVIDL